MVSKVTLSTFGLQEKWEKDPIAVKQMLNEQIENIRALKKSFEQAAEFSQQEKPIFILSALFIPQWKNGGHASNQNYSSSAYLKSKKEYFEYLRHKCHDQQIILEDSYESSTADEKEFLHQLEALGSHADLIKNKAIIKNKGVRHLQIDTNTIISDKPKFYAATLGASIQKDGFNASYYDITGLYVSLHNKVVYTCENSEFCKNLELHYKHYLNENKNNLDKKGPKTNEMYSVVFCKAAEQTGLVSMDRKYYKEWNNLWSCYPVKFENPEYTMTKHILTAINMSWNQGDGKVNHAANLQKIKAQLTKENGETTQLDFAAIAYIIKKYTNPNLPLAEREKLLEISNIQEDHKALRIFFNTVLEEKDLALFSALLSTIPASQPESQKISAFLYEGLEKKSLLKKLVKKLFKNFLNSSMISNEITPSMLQKIADFIPDNAIQHTKEQLLSLKSSLLSHRKETFQNLRLQLEEEIFEDLNHQLAALENEAFIATDEDKFIISDEMDKFSADLSFLTLDQILQNAKQDILRKIINQKVKQQDCIKEGLEQVTPALKIRISNKLYPLPQPLNDSAIEELSQVILKEIKVEQCKSNFFHQPLIIEFIKQLNNLAELRPYTEEREAEIEHRANILMNTVSTLSKNPDAPIDYSVFLNHANTNQYQFFQSAPSSSQIQANQAQSPGAFLTQ